MAELKEFFKSIFPDLNKYQEIQKEYHLIVIFVCNLGNIYLAISKDNHVYNLNFESNNPISTTIEMLRMINLANQQFTEYQKIKKEGS